MSKFLIALLFIGLTAMVIQSCEINGCSKGSMVSNTSGKDSKRMVGNCMQCHGPNGSGRGCFTIGGTVYDTTLTVTNPEAVIRLYTQPNGGGQLVATLDINRSGNFFTTSIINFGNGLYPVIYSKASSEVLYMPQSTVTGACGSCHGPINPRIWID